MKNEVLRAIRELNRKEIYFPTLLEKEYTNEDNIHVTILGKRGISLSAIPDSNFAFKELVLTMDGKLEEHCIDINGQLY
jgi:hypothetical protein